MATNLRDQNTALSSTRHRGHRSRHRQAVLFGLAILIIMWFVAASSSGTIGR
jgi:hypothetical protein